MATVVHLPRGGGSLGDIGANFGQGFGQGLAKRTDEMLAERKREEDGAKIATIMEQASQTKSRPEYFNSIAPLFAAQGLLEDTEDVNFVYKDLPENLFGPEQLGEKIAVTVHSDGSIDPGSARVVGNVGELGENEILQENLDAFQRGVGTKSESERKAALTRQGQEQIGIQRAGLPIAQQRADTDTALAGVTARRAGTEELDTQSRIVRREAQTDIERQAFDQRVKAATDNIDEDIIPKNNKAEVARILVDRDLPNDRTNQLRANHIAQFRQFAKSEIEVTLSSRLAEFKLSLDEMAPALPRALDIWENLVLEGETAAISLAIAQAAEEIRAARGETEPTKFGVLRTLSEGDRTEGDVAGNLENPFLAPDTENVDEAVQFIDSLEDGTHFQDSQGNVWQVIGGKPTKVR